MKQRPLYLQSRWVLGHFIILAVVVVMFSLGMWQRQRLFDTERNNAQIKSHLNGQPIQVTAVNAAHLPRYQRVTVTGSWDAPDTFLIRYPIHLGQQGYWEIEPVILDDGSSILVNKGWISQSAGQAMTKPTDADGGSAQITGWMQLKQTAHRPAGTNGARPGLVTMTAITQPWVQLVSPATASDPVPLDPPDLSKGPHFDYMLQWWSFCLITIAGWITLIRRAMQEQAQSDEVIDLIAEENEIQRRSMDA